MDFIGNDVSAPQIVQGLPLGLEGLGTVMVSGSATAMRAGPSFAYRGQHGQSVFVFGHHVAQGGVLFWGRGDGFERAKRIETGLHGGDAGQSLLLRSIIVLPQAEAVDQSF